MIRPDGRLRWQRWTCRAVFDPSGDLLEYQIVGRDITGRKRIEERLRAQGLFAQTLIEAMPVPVFFQDRQGLYRGCNKAFETLRGLARQDLVGRSVQDVFQPQEAAIAADKDRDLLRRGGRQVYETGLETTAGPRHVIVRKSVFRDADGKADGLIGIVLDITDRKRAEVAASKVRDDLEAGLARHAGELREANRRLVAEVAERQRIESELRRNSQFLETVLNAIQDGICVLSPDMTVLKVNQAMRALYNQATPLEGRKCHVVYRASDEPCEHCPTLRTLATGKLAIGVVPKVESGVETGWVELYAYPLFGEDGAVIGVAEIVRDVTARKKLEAELAVALERAETASRAKGAFLANMSHEIRTPLNAVLGYVQLMLRDHLDARQRERLAVVEESATALLAIINDILDYSKIEAGRLEIKAEPFDLVRCLEAVVKEQEVLARDKGLELLLELPPDLPPDRARRRAASAPDPAQSGQQCRQVHRQGPGDGVGRPGGRHRPGRGGRRPGPAASGRGRYGHGHSRAAAGHHLRQLHPGGPRAHPPPGRHRAWTGHLPPAGRAHGWRGLHGEPARAGKRVLAVVPVRDRPGRGAGRETDRACPGCRRLAAATHPAGRGQPDQSGLCCGPAHEPWPSGGAGREWPGRPGVFVQGRRGRGAHGHPDAGHGRPDRHPGHPGRAHGHRSGFGGGGPFGLRPGPGTRAVPGRRFGRIHHQTVRRGGVFRRGAARVVAPGPAGLPGPGRGPRCRRNRWGRAWTPAC